MGFERWDPAYLLARSGPACLVRACDCHVLLVNLCMAPPVVLRGRNAEYPECVGKRPNFECRVECIDHATLVGPYPVCRDGAYPSTQCGALPPLGFI